jgi:biopolymer transport protein ExbB
MSTVFNLIAVGGPVMIPIVGLSIATFASAMERAIFWFRVLRVENKIVHEVLNAAHYNLETAAEIAYKAQNQPIGRFLFSALQLQDSTPETFRLALQTAGEDEFVQMRRGNRLLETVVAIAPLLGLLGTVTGLIITFANLKIGGGSSSVDTSKAAAGIGEALVTTAGGMVVAIIALSFLRVNTTLQGKQVEYFAKVAGRLELIYRHLWYERSPVDEAYEPLRSRFANREV